jgi:ribonuclease T1
MMCAMEQARTDRCERGFARTLGMLVVTAVLVACTGGQASPTRVPSTPGSIATPAPATATADATPRFAVQPPSDWTGDTMNLDELPPEAIETLALIVDEGPFPYDQDGATFGNREGLLPDRPMGSYREYTVETPGSPDRGARRLVVGDDRDVYYTDDHYESFRFVVP